MAQKASCPGRETTAWVASVRADKGNTYRDMQGRITGGVKITKAGDAVANVVAFTGGSRAGGGFMFVILKAKAQRPPAVMVIGQVVAQASTRATLGSLDPLAVGDDLWLSGEA